MGDNFDLEELERLICLWKRYEGLKEMMDVDAALRDAAPAMIAELKRARDVEGMAKAIMESADSFEEVLTTQSPKNIDQNTWPNYIAAAVLRYLEGK